MGRDAAKTDSSALAKALIPLVGDRENMIEVTHCVTRLRFILKDEGQADTETIESLPGVLKVFSSGGQYQVVIGTSVPEVYRELMAALEETGEAAPVREAAGDGGTVSAPDDGGTELPAGKNAFRMALGKLSAFLTSCIQPLIPVLVSAGLIRTLAIALGPNMLGWLGAESGTIRILSLAGEAGFVFLPVFIAWSASNYLKINTALALFYGAFLVSPDLAALLNSGVPVRLYGLPVPAASYASQVVPVMLIMLVMYLVERMLKRWVPETVRFIGVPMLETLIMLPLMLCAVGPLGTMLGEGIAKGAIALHRVAGPLSVALIGALFTFICATGMHTAVIATAFALIDSQGYDSIALVGAGAAAYACFGVFLTYTALEKNKEARAIGLGALITHAVGGVAEPGMFTLLFPHAHLMCIQCVSAFFGALYLGIHGVGLYTPGISNFMAVFQYSGGEPANFRHAAIGCGISFLTGIILTAIYQIRKGHAPGEEAGGT